MKVNLKKKMPVMSEIPVVMTTEGDKLHVSASVKLSRKIMPQDVFVTVEASCGLSTAIPEGELESTRVNNAAYVRAKTMEQLAAQLELVHKEIGD